MRRLILIPVACVVWGASLAHADTTNSFPHLIPITLHTIGAEPSETTATHRAVTLHAANTVQLPSLDVQRSSLASSADRLSDLREVLPRTIPQPISVAPMVAGLREADSLNRPLQPATLPDLPDEENLFENWGWLANDVFDREAAARELESDRGDSWSDEPGGWSGFASPREVPLGSSRDTFTIPSPIEY
ncbi:MAG: hypothetical protein O3A51_04545 [Verrucomicrobia bacterium]|nr:hypothetical protein [Verrucomicrobiota bacterium]